MTTYNYYILNIILLIFHSCNLLNVGLSDIMENFYSVLFPFKIGSHLKKSVFKCEPILKPNLKTVFTY